MTRWANQDRFNDEIAAAHRHFGIPVSILKALVAIESGFDPDAYLEETGGDGSRGLMQIRASTAQGEGYHGRPENLFIPNVNLYYGASFLARLLATIPQLNTPQGSVPDYLAAVSAYNGGYRPERGFGARVKVETKNCLRKNPKTGQCVKWFIAHPGEFGNQPYVDRFRDALRYFGGGEKDLSASRGAGIALGIAAVAGFLLAKAKGVL